jgi:hypothetical protein
MTAKLTAWRSEQVQSYFRTALGADLSGQRRTIRVFQCPIAAIPKAYRFSISAQRPHSQIDEAPHAAWLGKGWLPRMPDIPGGCHGGLTHGMKAMQASYNPTNFNVGTSIFPGFNDRGGLVICGYEWGYNKKDQARDIDEKTPLDSFYFKAQRYDSPYDKRMLKWFAMFGHPLGIDDGYSEFDKSILQTNWCDSQGESINDYNKLEYNIGNFRELSG